MSHIPVLSKEVIEFLDIKEGDVYLDATLGEGGHAEEIFERFGNRVEISGIDTDSDAVEVVKTRLAKSGINLRVTTLNFRDIDRAPEVLGIKKPDKILFDLGWSKWQFEESGRGFSFQKDEPLLMTLTKDVEGVTAETILNSWDEDNIKTIIEAYGEERFAARIAKAIVEERKKARIKTTFQLVEIIKKATPTPYHFKRIHPATRTFQALRIAVNDELQALKEGLQKSFEILNNNGRIVVISFHSLEDRIVKNFFKLLKTEKRVEILTKRPLTANDEEIERNPRSRSAKLRAIKKL